MSLTRLPLFVRTCIILAGLALYSPPSSPAQEGMPSGIPEEQIERLRGAAQIEDPEARVDALDRFLQSYPDTPLKADVYRLQFMSLREFTRDDDHLWAVGEKYLDAAARLADTRLPAYARNPILAEAYNEVAYTFADRGSRQDDALGYARQALSLARKAALERPPQFDEAQWSGHIDQLRGQILDTLGWIQFKRKVLPEAEEAITEALALLPDHGTLHFHLGQIRLANGQTRQAMDAYLMAATAEQPEEEAKTALKRLYEDEYGAAGESRLEEALEQARTKAKERQKQKLVSNRIDTPAPEADFTSLAGETISLSDLRGRVVVINFWATWCPPCREEMPALQSLWTSYRDNEAVAFLIASVDQEQDKVQPYIDRHGYTFPVYFGLSAAQNYRVQSIPTTLVIDKNGSVQFMHVGYRPDIAEVLGWQIEALTAE